MTLILEDHAIERYVERVRPTLTFDQAKAELARLLPNAERRHEMPPWADSSRLADASRWLMLGDDIALPMNPSGVVKTCLVRGSGPADCAQRAAERAERRRPKNHHGPKGVRSTQRDGGPHRRRTRDQQRERDRGAW